MVIILWKRERNIWRIAERGILNTLRFIERKILRSFPCVCASLRSSFKISRRFWIILIQLTYLHMWRKVSFSYAVYEFMRKMIICVIISSIVDSCLWDRERLIETSRTNLLSSSMSLNGDDGSNRIYTK